MSGGGRYGETRKRKARPVATVGAGTHNRKARRAAKSQARRELSPEELEAIAARSRARFERMRTERAAYWATQTEADILDMRLAESARECAGFDPWLLPLLFDAIPRWIHRHFDTDPDARIARAHECGEVIAFSQGSALIADQADTKMGFRLSPEDRAAAGEVFNAIAEGLALGAYCPGGAMFGGVEWQVAGSELRVTERDHCTVHRLDDDGYWADRAGRDRELCVDDNGRCAPSAPGSATL